MNSGLENGRDPNTWLYVCALGAPALRVPKHYTLVSTNISRRARENETRAQVRDELHRQPDIWSESRRVLDQIERERSKESGA